MSTAGSLTTINKSSIVCLSITIMWALWSHRYKLSLVMLHLANIETIKPEDVNTYHQITTSTRFSDSAERWCVPIKVPRLSQGEVAFYTLPF